MTAVGDHICCVYYSPHERRNQLSFWVREGLAAGERVIGVEEKTSRGTFLNCLENSGIETSPHTRTGQLMAMDADEAYLDGGVFSPNALFEQHSRTVAQALGDGYPAVRISGDGTVAVRALGSLDLFLEAERSFEQLCATQRISCLCQFDSRQFDSAELTRLAHIHPRRSEDRLAQVTSTGNVLWISGEIDLSNACLLDGASAALAERYNDIWIDLSEALHVDVIGLRYIVELAHKLGPGRTLTVSSAPSWIQRMRKPLKLDRIQNLVIAS
jgi:anti-anti-sigma regulatory factor